MNDLEEVRSRYGRLVWSTVYRVLRDHAESLDCYQDVFCELLQRAEKGTGPICAKHPEGRSGKLDLSPFPSPREVKNWPAYLRWLATHRAIDRLRSRQRRQGRLDPGDTAIVPSSAPGPSETAQLNELAKLVRHELTKLPQRQAEAFWLACIEEMTYEEVGRQLGVTTSTVGGLVHRARRRLRDVLTALKVRDPGEGGHRHG
jgi:RNA polymerase sigma factor (sigma-70 family)